MAAQSFSSIPLIDIAPLRDGAPPEQRRVAEALGRAARDVGFLYIAGTGFEERLFDDLLEAARRFFALPIDEKMRTYIGRSTNHRGYVPEGEEFFASGARDKKEAFDLALDLSADDPDYRDGNPLLGPNQWPELPGFRAAVSAYYQAVFGLGRMLMRGFAMALGEAADFFEPYITRPPSQLRLIHYPYDAEARDAVGIGAHTDYECFTLLRSTSPGLEVMNDDGRWIEAPPRPGAFVVNIGDMLELWTNGEFVATSHRVRKVREERYSFPLFFAVDYHTRVEPLARFVTPARPARPGLVAGEHLFAQTVQSFRYQQQRLARGEIKPPEQAPSASAFGREVRMDKAG